MLNIDALQRDFKAKADAGLALVASTAAACKAEGNREMTADERTAIETISADARALKDRITRATSDSELLASLERMAGTALPSAPVPHGPRKGPQSMGQQFISAPQYDFFRKGGHRTASAWRSDSVELFAATLTEDPASGGSLVAPQYMPGITATPTPKLTVADLIAPGTTDSNLVAYMREKTWTNAAAPVLEGAAKPESTLTFEAAQAPVRKIATWLPVTEEMLEDAPAIRSYIDARLSLGVKIAEEDQLLDGTGVAPQLLGIRATPGLAADVVRGAAEPNYDAILRQIMAIYATSLFMPDGIVMNPADWGTTILTKGPQGQYYTPGPFAPIQSQTLWGLPVATTPAIDAGVSLVGAFQQAAQIFRKGGIRVEASNSHQDFFVKNLVAIRAEERLALAVYRPGAFGEVTGLGVVVLP